jgi:hypothetical protein
MSPASRTEGGNVGGDPIGSCEGMRGCHFLGLSGGFRIAFIMWFEIRLDLVILIEVFGNDGLMRGGYVSGLALYRDGGWWVGVRLSVQRGFRLPVIRIRKLHG